MNTNSPCTVYLKDYRPFGWQVDHIDLSFSLFEDRAVVHAQTRFRREGGGETLFLNGEDLTLVRVALDGRVLKEGVDFTRDCTQCEAEGFRRITYFPDRPDVLASIRSTHHRRQGEPIPLLLSNGNFLGGAGYGDGKHFAAWFDPHPKPSYLFALVAGDLGVVEDTFTTMSGREVALGSMSSTARSRARPMPWTR
jgi:aminopeptidase N